MYRMTWDLLDASTVPMGAAELFTSLQQGVVDGQENPLEFIDNFKFNEVQKYAIDTRHVIGAMTWIYSDARFKRLPPDVQTLLKVEGDRVLLEASDKMAKLESGLRDKLSKSGMQFSDIDREALRSRLGPIAKEFPELAPWAAKFAAVK
jgi:TRAP-type C4-dicarboxylate transport system substrate-binding protein